MYELDYTPVQLDDFNDYFILYRKTKDIKYFNDFLYFYEPILSRYILQFINQYGLSESRIEDLKQIFAALLWEELKSYDSDIPLLQLIKFKVLKSWHEHVRTNCGSVSVNNSNQYKTMRKVAVLYYRQSKDKTFGESVSAIAKELNISESNVRNCILASERFKQNFNLDIDNQANERVFYTQTAQKDISTLSPENLFFIHQQRYALCKALQSLKTKDKKLIELVFGICPDCLMNKERKTLREASLLLGLTESGAEQKLKKILKKLKNTLQE